MEKKGNWCRKQNEKGFGMYTNGRWRFIKIKVGKAMKVVDKEWEVLSSEGKRVRNVTRWGWAGMNRHERVTFAGERRAWKGWNRKKWPFNHCMSNVSNDTKQWLCVRVHITLVLFPTHNVQFIFVDNHAEYLQFK